jgi:glycosyltransferase involved in cell wall biosynthesis
VRILLVIPYFYPMWVCGGPVKVAYDVSRELIRRGHEVTVYTSNGIRGCLRVDSRINEVDAIRVHYFRNVSEMTAREMKLFITPEMIPVVRKEIQSFDIVHLHEYRSFQNVVVHHYAKKYGVPYILQAHGSLLRIMAKQRLKWIYDMLFGNELLRDASKVIALNQTEAQQYRFLGVPEEKVEVIPNGIDLSEYADLPPKGCFKKKFSINDDEKIVLYIGRIHQSKGLSLLAEAFSIVLKELEKVRLAVVGPDDGYSSAFSALISNLGINEKVLLTGFIEKEDKLAALVDSVVFVTPRFSGFPITFLEACVTELPVITTKRGDQLNLINNGAGFVVEYSPQSFAEALIYLLRNVDISRRVGQSAKKLLLNEFTLQKVVDKLEKVYETNAKGLVRNID